MAAVMDYMVKRGPQPGPFFTFESGWYLTRERFVKTMRVTLMVMGVDCSLFVGHSSRIGEATVAAQRGTQNYIRTPRKVLCGVAAIMMGQRDGRKEGPRRS